VPILGTLFKNLLAEVCLFLCARFENLLLILQQMCDIGLKIK